MTSRLLSKQLCSAYTDQGHIGCRQVNSALQQKIKNLILPAEAASMPSSRWVLVLQLLPTWDPNRVVHQGTRL